MLRPIPVDHLPVLTDCSRGLTSAEAAAQRGRFGPNAILEAPPGGWRHVLIDTLKDPMVSFLAVTSALFATVGNRLEASLMLAAIVPLVAMDAFLHRRTQVSTAALRGRLAEHADIVRDGERRRLPALDVVPGDLAIVAAGTPFPADGLVIDGAELQTDESALTGEAFPVAKQRVDPSALGTDQAAIDVRHWVFAGTRLLTSTAHVRILATGAETMYGEIVRSAAGGSHARTPLQRAIGRLVLGLLLTAIALCAVLAWVRWHQGHGIVDALISALTLAIAAFPEEFPVVFTFFLGVGIVRLARRRALVRRAVAVENIGRVTYICSDKTGTLTEGRVVVAHLEPALGATNEELLTVAARASRWDSHDPLDAAILTAAPAQDFSYQRLATFPFTESRRRETALYRGDTRRFAVTKGAPENILSACTLDAATRDDLLGRITALANEGHKVIGCAVRDCTEEAASDDEPASGFRFMGLIACEDPVREGVASAVRSAQAAGIRIVMITGDHPGTAAAIARETGIGGAAPIVMDGDLFATAVANGDWHGFGSVDVIARAAPAQKLALVRALQSRGEIVAVTGDGVNDVPALQAADVGIAMGERGTTSARQIAAVVLLDDNFRTIVHAIAEGRQLFRNLRASFAYLLMMHLAIVATATIVPLAGYPLLYLPIHIVWLELVLHPTALLVFQEGAQNAQLEALSGTAADGRFYSRREWVLIGAIGVALCIAVLWAFDHSLATNHDVEQARTMALVVLSAASATLALALSGRRNRTGWLLAAATVGMAVMLAQVPAAAPLLHIAPLRAGDWIVALLLGALPAVAARAIRKRGAR